MVLVLNDLRFVGLARFALHCGELLIISHEDRLLAVWNLCLLVNILINGVASLDNDLHLGRLTGSLNYNLRGRRLLLLR